MPRDEQLKVAMLHRAEARWNRREARGHGWADRCAVTLQMSLPPLVGCNRRELVTMPRVERSCQCSAKEKTNHIVSWERGRATRSAAPALRQRADGSGHAAWPYLPRSCLS